MFAGKTALHWAVAVDNRKAVRVLLMSGANRDAQDVNDETPLFVAAKEGCADCARILLDFCANRDASDNMERLPRDVAEEKLHRDIVKMLDEYQPEAHILNGFPVGGPMLPTFMSHLRHGGMMGHGRNGGGGTRKKKSRSSQGQQSARARSPARERTPRSISPPPKKQVRVATILLL